MEQNYFEKVISCFTEPILSTFASSSHNISKREVLESEKKTELFHTDCKFSKKKICHCNQFKSNLAQKDSELAEFLDQLVNDKIEICCNTYNKKLEFKKKENFALLKKNMEAERLRNISYSAMKDYLRLNDENILSLSEYKEIERSINEDKKICENCKTNIYENNFHKGWKNELGEYVLLCPLCSRKYFNGALEIKFESKRIDEVPLHVMKSFNSGFTKAASAIEIMDPPSSMFISFLNLILFLLFEIFWFLFFSSFFMKKF